MLLLEPVDHGHEPRVGCSRLGNIRWSSMVWWTVTIRQYVSQ